MFRIERIAVDADVGLIAAMFESRLQAIMVRLAKRSDRAEQKGVVVPTMRREMIGDRRRRDLAFRLTKLAQRLDLKLVFARARQRCRLYQARTGIV